MSPTLQAILFDLSQEMSGERFGRISDSVGPYLPAEPTEEQFIKAWTEAAMALGDWDAAEAMVTVTRRAAKESWGPLN